MCIIVYKPAGAKISKQILKNCYENNPDGAGFMNLENGKVMISKGYMDWKSFWTDASKLSPNLPVVYHFRIRTHGATSKELCHPYPITSSYKLLHSQTVLSDYGVAHNGIFSNLPTVADESDTTIFISNVLNPLRRLAIKDKSSLNEYKYKDLLNFVAGSSKLAIMDTFGNVGLYGSGWLNDNGCYFSNYSYTNSYYDYVDKYSSKALYPLTAGAVLSTEDSLFTIKTENYYYTDTLGKVYTKSSIEKCVYKSYTLSFDYNYDNNIDFIDDMVIMEVLD